MVATGLARPPAARQGAPMVVGSEWGLGEVFVALLVFNLFVLWIWLVISVFVDVFRSGDLSGWAKAAWCLLVIVVPFLGVFAYLVVRGRTMGDRTMDAHRGRAAP